MKLYLIKILKYVLSSRLNDKQFRGKETLAENKQFRRDNLEDTMSTKLGHQLYTK